MYCDVFDEVEAAEKATKAAGYKRETRVRYKDGSVTKKHSTKKHSDERRDENREEARTKDDSNRGNARRRRRVNRRMEPKLETKSARRQSRRAFNMETAEMEAFGDGDSFEEEEEKASRDDDDEKTSARGFRAGERERYGDDDDVENADWAQYSRARRGADAETRE